MTDYTRIDNYIERLISESDTEYTAWNMEKAREGKKADWNYIDGCMITALLQIGDTTGRPEYFDFAENFLDSFIYEDGTIRTFKPEEKSLDNINEGRVLFELYDKTGKEKYREAADMLMGQLKEQPRTREGNFWHKAIYPDQVWLDGIYMAQPFYVMYEKYFGTQDYSDSVKQICNVSYRMRDDLTGLYYHGYDASKSIFWADPVTGCSASFWLRSIGWFAVALTDILELLPEGMDKDTISGIFKDLIDSIDEYADEDSGMYWQVVDQPEREGNYLETSGSSMIAYAMLKGERLGILDKRYAAKGVKTFNGIADRYLSFSDDGSLRLGGICLVAGLGPEDDRRRDGSYDYYISEPVVENDAKGVAPFVLAYSEILRNI